MRKYLILLLLLICASTGWAKTATYTVNASAGDAGATVSESGSTASYVYIPYSKGSERRAFARFQLYHPLTATITDARLILKSRSSTQQNVQFDVVDYADCALLSINPFAYNVAGSAVTGQFTGTFTDGGTLTSPDISSLITTYVGITGVATGTYIGLRAICPNDSCTTSTVYNYDQGASYAPQLTITYTGGEGVIDLMMSEPHVKTKQYIYVGVWNQDAGDVISVSIDNTEVSTYTIQAGDVPANAATRFEKSFLLDYTALHAGEHHIDIVLKTSGGTPRTTSVEGKTLKTWTTTHDHYPLVGINENNVVCLANEADTACTPFFPLTPFMWDYDKWDSGGYKAAVNGLDVEGWYATHDATSWDYYLDHLAAVTDAESGLTYKGMGPGRGAEYSVNYTTSTGDLTNGEAVTWVNGSGQTAGQGFVYFTGAMASPVVVWSTAGSIGTGYVITGSSSGKSITVSSKQYTVINNLATSVVTTNKTHASMLGWKFEDEPELRAQEMAWNPSQSEAVAYANYLKVKTIDTDHPHGVSHYGYAFVAGANNRQYAEAYSYLTGKKRWINDITGGDIYPYEFSYEGSSTYNGIPVSLESALSGDDSYIAYNYGLIPHFTAVQPTDEKTCQTTDANGSCTAWASGSTRHCVGSSGALGAKVWTPDPTAAQVKNELWLRVIHGAVGIIYFNYFCPVLDYQIAEMQAFKTLLEVGVNATDPLAPIILSAKSSKYTPVTRTVGAYTVPLNHGTVTAGADGRVDYMIREYAGSTWVFAARVKKASGETFEACNTTGVSAGAVRCTEGATFGVWPDSTNTNTKSATIPVTGLSASTTVGVFGEDRNVTSGDGTITDNFTDYDVHIYKIGDDATDPTTYNVTISYVGHGTTDPAEGVHAYGAGQITVTQTPSDDASFSAWSGTCGCTGSGTCTPTLSADCTIIATWTDDPQYQLLVNYPLHGEVVVSDVAGINCGGGNLACVANYYSQVVTLTTTCPSGFMNPTYSGDCTGSTCTPTMSADKQVAVSCACSSCFTIGSGGTATLGSGGSGGGSQCNASSDKLGTNDTSGTAANRAKDSAWCSLFTPSCYGPLKTAYAAHADTNTSNLKVCVYSDNGDGVIGATDLKVGCSGDIASSSVEFASSAMDGGALSSGSYWVCSFVKADAANTFNLDKDSVSTTLYYKSSSGYYASPPDNLGGDFNHVTSNNHSNYITVGP